MFAIIGAILFAIALIIDLAKPDVGISASTFVTAGLLCVSLHLAGLGALARSSRGRWSLRR